jgi:hypothetical protein
LLATTHDVGREIAQFGAGVALLCLAIALVARLQLRTLREIYGSDRPAQGPAVVQRYVEGQKRATQWLGSFYPLFTRVLIVTAGISALAVVVGLIILLVG